MDAKISEKPYGRPIAEILNADDVCDMVIFKRGQSNGVSACIINPQVDYILFEPPTPISEIKNTTRISTLELIARMKRK